MRRLGLFVVSLGLFAGWQAADAQDAHRHSTPNAAPAVADVRELIRLPAPMQDHMLANMRDHLVAVGEIAGYLADGKFDAAAKVSEQRLGMSSLSGHGAAHMAPFMPQPMQNIGTAMHRAASRLAITIQDADVAPAAEAAAAVNRGLHEVLSSCNACHASYRIR